MSVLRWLDKHIEEVFLVFFSIVMVCTIFMQVVMRQLDNSLSWTEEMARYSFIWLVYIGISYGVKKQRHLKVDVMLLLFKDRGKLVFSIISNILFLVFCLFVVYYGFDISKQLLDFGQTSPANKIPMGLVYLATPVGMGLTSIRIIQHLVKQGKALVGSDSFDVKTEHEKYIEKEGVE
jgi:TRAP-type C4-dicarboxylate transport system permease small subunit